MIFNVIFPVNQLIQFFDPAICFSQGSNLPLQLRIITFSWWLLLLSLLWLSINNVAILNIHWYWCRISYSSQGEASCFSRCWRATLSRHSLGLCGGLNAFPRDSSYCLRPAPPPPLSSSVTYPPHPLLSLTPPSLRLVPHDHSRSPVYRFQ